MSENLVVYVVYDHPKDNPGHFVVRPWSLGNRGFQPSLTATLYDTLEEARKTIPATMRRFDRFENDDPCIVEVWI